MICLPKIARAQMTLFCDTVESLADQHAMVRVLEIGSGWGFSAEAFLSHARTRLVTIDRKAAAYGDAFEIRLRQLGWRGQVKRIIGESSVVLPRLHGPYHLIYVDGDHGYTGVREDLENSLRLLSDDGVLFADDVQHPAYPGATQALGDFLAAHPTAVGTIHACSYGVAEIHLHERNHRAS